MKTLRIILIIVLVLYGLGPLSGAILSFFYPEKHAAYMELGVVTPGIKKLLLISGALLVGQVWLYFSAIALLTRNMKQGYMYAVTIGFIEFIQAIVIVVALETHNFGSPTDYFALLKGAIILALALYAFKKQQSSANI